MWKIVVTGIIAVHMSTMMQSAAREPNASNVSSLESRATKLDDDVTLWTRLSLFFVALTAFSAVAYGVSQGYLVARSKQATKVRADLIAAKDQQLKEEFAHRDERIAQVQADANVHIAQVEATARTEAKRIESEANEKISAANERAGAANKEAGEARASAAKALLAQEELQRENLKISRTLEAERTRRVQLQRSVFHRMIPQIAEGDKTNWDSLKPFKGVSVAFRYAPGREPELFVGNLGTFPANAGWKTLSADVAGKDEISDGVTVLGYVGANGETDRSMEAAKAFAEFVASQGIEEVRFAPAKRGQLKPDMVLVLIGQMPDPFKNLE